MNQLVRLARNKDGGRVYRCPLCGDSVTVESNVFYGQCPSCQATVIDYKPLPHQSKFLSSSAPFLLMIGGFGSGKTTAAVAKLVRHAFATPGGKSLITGPKLQLVEDTSVKELDKFLPPYMIKRRTKKPATYIELLNGHEIVVYASNDEQNLRGINLSAFYIEEASNVDYSVFQQLQSRLRNAAALKYDENDKVISDKTMGIVCTNPDDGWVRDKFLLYSKNLYASKSVDTSNYEKLKHRQQFNQFESFLSSSRDNTYLPPQFIPNLTIGKTREWIRKFVDCQLDIKEGAVYPEFTKNIVEPFPIPENWLRVAGFDRGWSDPTTLLLGAIDPKEGIVYIYDEYGIANQPIGYHALQVRDRIGGLKLYAPIQACPSVLQTSDRDGKSYQDHFLRLSGIYLQPHQLSIQSGIETVREYMYQGKLKFFSNCSKLKEEASKYTYREATSTREVDDIPIDKYNHFMDSMRYLVMALPANPNDLKASVGGVTVNKTFSVIRGGQPQEANYYLDPIEDIEQSVFKGGVHRGR